MDFLSVIPLLKDLIGLVPSESKRIELTSKLQEFELELAKGQLAVNAEEAKNASLFVSGWRPAVGWICTLGVGYNAIVAPLFGFPRGEFEVLFTLLFGMLGLGGLRTYEKVKGITK